MTEALLSALTLSTLAGAAIPAGAALASVERFMPNWIEDEFRHSVIAFGGGALFSAIALVLVPEGAERVSAVPALACFILGGLVFLWADMALERRGGRAAQFMAMMLDFLPEAMALGALLSGDGQTATLLAVLIALQNLPEGFNAYRELQDNGPVRSSRLALIFLLVVPVGPLAAFVGLTVLNQHPAVLGGIMLFAAGGILYLLFEDVAPQVPLERSWAPALGGVVGFAFGFAGHLALSG